MILLLNPKSAQYGIRVPNTILTLGALLEGKYDYALIDQNLEPDIIPSLVRIIKEKNVKYLGITVMPGPQLHHAVPVSKKIKLLFPEIKIIWGGYFPSFHPNTVLKSGYVDYVLRGRAENTFVEFIDAMEGKPGSKDLRTIGGLSYRMEGKEVIPLTPFKGGKHHSQFKGGKHMPDPDSIPRLPYNRVNVEKYLRMGRTYLGKRTIGYVSSYVIFILDTYG